jgi:acetyl-CoA carboxylase biotin carboxyl carrier protein
VSENGSKIGSPFDVQTVRQLVALMSRHDLSEIDLREGDLRIRLRRGPTTGGNASAMPIGASMPVGPMAMSMPHMSAVAPAPPGGVAAAENGAKPSRTLHEIKSPTPGTFYAASSPDTEAFVKVGARVEPTTVVCLIEAMKIFNEITAECSGTITEILAENQQPVEYGQVLFRVDPAG